MLVRNNAKRLITFNTNSGDNKKNKAYNLMPAGSAVDLPKEVTDTKYFKELLKLGDVVQEGVAPVTETEEDENNFDDLEDLTKDELLAKALNLGVVVDGRSGEATIIKKIREHQAA